MDVLWLGCAIGSGVTGTLFTRASKGFTRWLPSLGALVAYGTATLWMAWLVESLPVGVGLLGTAIA